MLPRQLDRLGAGPGLTPYADDVLCGMLVALRAAGHHQAERWSAIVAAAALEQRTTATSAALVRLAADGWCIDPLADHLNAIATGCAVENSARALGRVGHSSGHGLLEGVAAVVDGARLREAG